MLVPTRVVKMSSLTWQKLVRSPIGGYSPFSLSFHLGINATRRLTEVDVLRGRFQSSFKSSSSGVLDTLPEDARAKYTATILAKGGYKQGNFHVML
jgi:hypothetical protein